MWRVNKSIRGYWFIWLKARVFGFVTNNSQFGTNSRNFMFWQKWIFFVPNWKVLRYHCASFYLYLGFHLISRTNYGQLSNCQFTQRCRWKSNQKKTELKSPPEIARKSTKRLLKSAVGLVHLNCKDVFYIERWFGNGSFSCRHTGNLAVTRLWARFGEKDSRKMQVQGKSKRHPSKLYENSLRINVKTLTVSTV